MEIPHKRSKASEKLAYEKYLIGKADIDLILEYALQHLEHRLVVAEPIIQEDKNAWERYCEALNYQPPEIEQS